MVKVLTLKKRKDFVRVAAGQKMVTHNLVLQAAQSLSAAYRQLDGQSCWLGFTVTKKVGKANFRNRTKRRLRAAAREVFPKMALPDCDYVIIGRYSTAGAEFTRLVNDLKMSVKRINKLLKAQSGAAGETADEISPDSAD